MKSNSDDFNRPWWETRKGCNEASQTFIDENPEFINAVQSLQPTFEPLSVFGVAYYKPAIENFDSIKDFEFAIAEYDNVWKSIGRVFHGELGAVPQACMVTRCTSCGSIQWMAWGKTLGLIKHGYPLYVLLNACYPFLFHDWITYVRTITGMNPEENIHKPTCKIYQNECLLQDLLQNTKG
jgi:hypothetical protein